MTDARDHEETLRDLVDISYKDDPEPNYWWQGLDGTNVADAYDWFQKDMMVGICDDRGGGIIGYIHHAHADLVVRALNTMDHWAPDPLATTEHDPDDPEWQGDPNFHERMD